VKLYIWEGRGISSAYHDDGTLVVLAESPEHARQVVKNAERAYRAAIRRAGPTIKAIRAEMQALVDWLKELLPAEGPGTPTPGATPTQSWRF